MCFKCLIWNELNLFIHSTSREKSIEKRNESLFFSALYGWIGPREFTFFSVETFSTHTQNFQLHTFKNEIKIFLEMKKKN